jgi:hypothetical protein
MKTLFPLRIIVATPGTLAACEAAGESPIIFVLRHAAGDFGDLSALDEAGTGLDLDAATDTGLELTPRPKPLFDFDDLDRVVTSESARPVGIHVNAMAQREYSYSAPGMSQAVRITTDPEFYQEHAESVELWSPGNPVFPAPEIVAEVQNLPQDCSVGKLLDSGAGQRPLKTSLSELFKTM